jgi:uncharacterized protein with PQ loop repeat
MLLGTIGGICFAFSGLPQAYKSWKDGHSDGITYGTIWLWLIGEGMMLAYALHFYTSDLILILNYTFNFLLVFIIFKYKYWKRKMIKTKRITKEIVEDVVEDIICNKCGCSLKDECNLNFEGLVEADIIGGYCSKLGDMTRIRFSLCENCLIEMFKTFKHDPYVPDYEEEFNDESNNSTDNSA